MSGENYSPFDEGSLVAENDLSAAQYKVVEQSSDSQVDLCDGAADHPLGILQNAPTAGQEARVRVLGLSLGVADGSGTAIVAGDPLKQNGSGVLVKATADGDVVMARARKGTSSANVQIEVFVHPPIKMSVPA